MIRKVLRKSKPKALRKKSNASVNLPEYYLHSSASISEVDLLGQTEQHQEHSPAEITQSLPPNLPQDYNCKQCSSHEASSSSSSKHSGKSNRSQKDRNVKPVSQSLEGERRQRSASSCVMFKVGSDSFDNDDNDYDDHESSILKRNKLRRQTALAYYTEVNSDDRVSSPLTSLPPYTCTKSTSILDSPERERNILRENTISNSSLDVMMMPQHPVTLSPNYYLRNTALLGGNKMSLSSASLDSGVASAGNSKRSSLEQVSPLPSQSGLCLSRSLLSGLSPGSLGGSSGGGGRGGGRLGVSRTLSQRRSDSSMADAPLPPIEDCPEILTVSNPDTEAGSEILANSTADQRMDSRLNIGVDKVTELLETVVKLIEDASTSDGVLGSSNRRMVMKAHPYLKNSLNHFKRQRKSYSDLISQQQQQQQLEHVEQRKQSADAILRRIPSSSSSNSLHASFKVLRRNTSGCIMCDRCSKRRKDSLLQDQAKVIESGETSVIFLRTTLTRKIQMRNRFSEVLKVYGPGDLPFTEYVIPRISDLKIPTGRLGEMHTSNNVQAAPGDTTPPENERLRSIVDDNMPKFVQLTNWGCLYAHLVANKLLDSNMREYINSTNISHQQKGNKFYGEHMLSLDGQGYQRLLKCFMDEEDHEGHKELVALLVRGKGS